MFFFKDVGTWVGLSWGFVEPQACDGNKTDSYGLLACEYIVQQVPKKSSRLVDSERILENSRIAKATMRKYYNMF